MSDTISKNNVSNGKSAIMPNKIDHKYPDVERGEVVHPCHGGGGPTSSSSTSTSTSEVGAPVSILIAREDGEVGTGCSSDVLPGVTQDCQGTRGGSTKERDNRSRRRSKPVVRFILRAALIMILVAGAAVGLAALAFYTGPLFLLQLLVVAAVAYFVAGGRLRWLYVALMTAPRDVVALMRYLKLRWVIRSHAKKNRIVADVFQQYVARHPNKPCFICEDQEWTFQQIEDFSNKVATIFKTHGYRGGDVVGLLLENRPEFVAIWLGLSKLGVIISFINTNLRKATLLHSINIVKCQALIYGSNFTEALSDIASSLDAKLALYKFGEETKTWSSEMKEKDLIALMAEVSPVPPVIQDRPAYHDKLLYIYTSGTTGLPKAAVITNSRFMFIASAMHYVSPFKNSDRFYTALPLYHTAGGIMAIGQALLHGNTIVIRKKFSASSYFKDCIKYKCTVAQYIGEMCRYILAVPPKPEDTQHNVHMIFGNGLRPQIWQDFVKRFNISRVAEFYGATEGNANIVNVDNTMGAIGFVSRIIPSVYPISIIKVNADGEPIRNSKGLCQVCEPNEPGAFIGKIVPFDPTRAFLGYVDQKASSSKVIYDVFKKGDSAFLSGDLLVADEFGYLFFKDRTGDTFRWKGENVSTSEIEAIVSNLINYRDCIVYGVEVRGVEGRAGMAAIYDENGTLDLQRLSVDIREQLPSYARPQFVRILTKIDLTGTFKLQKKDLQQEAYDPRKVNDKLYYLDSKCAYQLLTPEVFDQIQEGKIRF